MLFLKPRAPGTLEGSGLRGFECVTNICQPFLDYLRPGLGPRLAFQRLVPNGAGATAARPRFPRCCVIFCLSQDTGRKQEVEHSCWRYWALSLP